MAQLKLTLLGGFRARLDPGSSLVLPTRKAQALLAYLALPLGRAHPREKLAALLWGGIREPSARASLRQALFSIRRTLAGAERTLRQEGATIALDSATVDVDATAFEAAMIEGTPQAIERAAALYQGDLLSGFVLGEPPFEEWLLAERERLRELAVEGLAKLLVHQRKAGPTEPAIQTALRLLTLDPLQEPVQRTLMRLYAEAGRRGAALRQYQHCVSVLGRELGIEPEAETKVLYQEILRQRPQRSAVEAAAALEASRADHATPTVGAETRLIGRAPDLERLYAELDRATAGAGRVVAVVGEAGIGKSRLVGELVAGAAHRGVAVLVGRAYQSEQILPFAPWVDALRAGHVAADAELLARLGPALRSELTRLLPEIGGGSATAAAATDARLIFESVTQLLGDLSRRRTLLVVLEDLHWADEMSARLLAFVGLRLSDRPVIVVATTRDDEIADAPALRQTLDDLEREGRLTTLALGPLSRLDTVALVVAFGRLGDDAAVDRLGERAWAASEGNPFVAVETVRAHAENTWVAQAGGLALPERVREIVGRRLERLSERAQSVAAVAAVIGRGFEFALLQRAAGLGEEETAAGVEELVRRRVLHGQGERFDFTHDRVRDVAWSRMLAPRRKLIHRRVAEAIEALYAANLGSHALALGLHYRDAEVWDHAARHLHMAGCAARDHAANREAVASFDAALECLRNLPDDRARSERLVDTVIEQEAALMGLGEFQRSLAGLREAEAIARALGDRLRLGWIFGRFAYNLGSIGDLDAAIEHAEQARRIGIEVDDARCHVSSNVVLARARYARGDYREAMEAVRENDELARRRTRVVLDGHALRNSPFSRIWGVLALAELGEFAEAIVQGEEALRESAAFGSHPVVWAHLGVGRLYLVKGDFAQAIELLERALPLCETAGDLAVYFSRTAASLGGAYAQSGRLDEALALLERADRHAESIGFAYGRALVIATLAEAKLLAGEIDEAARIADSAVTRSRQHGQRGWEAWARRLQGQIATHGDPLDPGVGEGHFRVAMELARERGMQPLIAHCHAGLAKLFQRTGDRSELDQHVTAATAMYRAMGMTSWVEKTEAELQV